MVKRALILLLFSSPARAAIHCNSGNTIFFSTYQTTSNTYSFSFWVNIGTSNAAHQGLIENNTASGIDWNTATNKISFTGNTGDQVQTKIWNHLCISVNNNSGPFYLNGISSGTAIGAGAVKFFLMCNTFTNLRFLGDLDDVAIYNRPLTQNECKSLAFSKCRNNITQGRVAYYPLDDGPPGEIINANVPSMRDVQRSTATAYSNENIIFSPSILSYCDR